MTSPPPHLVQPRLVIIAMLAALLAGCGTTAADLPLPGDSVGGETYRVTATFDDALNLAEGAAVTAAGVPIGRVSAITVKDFRAEVTMEITDERTISTGADFRLRSTTALGELFVDVVDDPAVITTIPDGGSVDDGLTSAAPTVEDTLAAASLFINGGGLAQISTIVEETNAMVGGREDAVRDVVQRLASTAEALTAASDDVDAALTALADVSAVLDERKQTLTDALTRIQPAAAVLRENTGSLVGLLASIDAFGGTVVPVVQAVRDDLLLILAEAGPVFDEVAAIEPEIEAGSAAILEFVKALDRAVPSNYLNTHLYFQGELSIGGLTLGPGLLAPGGDEAAPVPAAPGLPDLPHLPGLLDGLLPQQPSSGQPTPPAPASPGLSGLLPGLTGGAS